MAIYSGNGGSEFLVNTTTQDQQEWPEVASLSTGGFVISWRDFSGQGGDPSGYGVKAQIFDASGAKAGSEFLVNTATLSAQDQPTIASLSSGGFVVSWQDFSGEGGDSDGAIKAQVFDASGGKVGSEFLVNTETSAWQINPAIASLASGGFVISWQGDSGIKAQIFDASGEKMGSEFLVNTEIENSQQYSTIASLASGGFIVSWSDFSEQGGDADDFGIKAQIFDASGARLGSEFLVNTETLNWQWQPTVASLASGGFVISWIDESDRGLDASGAGIKAQIFDASGAKVGSEFLVNTLTPGTQWGPTIASLSSGGFIVSWSDNSGRGGDASFSGIKAQIFDASGAKVGSEFLVNTETLNVQEEPTIATLSSGDFVISWTDWNRQAGEGSDSEVKARILSLANTAPTAVDDAATTDEDTPVVIAVLDNDYDDYGALRVSEVITTGTLGTVTINPDNTISYDPSPAFGHLGTGESAIDAFQYYSVDSGGLFSLATVAVVVEGLDEFNRISGTTGNDNLVGTEGADLILALSGYDVLLGIGHNDELHGGQGSDTLLGGEGDDDLYGGVGDDFLLGGEGDDEFYGGGGNDFLFGGEGDDELWVSAATTSCSATTATICPTEMPVTTSSTISSETTCSIRAPATITWWRARATMSSCSTLPTGDMTR